MIRGRPYLLLLSCCLAGCSRGGVPSDAETTSVATPAPAASTSEPSLPAPPEEPAYPMPGPYRGRLEAAVALNATCVLCHEEEAKQWRGSHHQQATLNPAYRKALAIEPLDFCRGCHAPESDPTKEPPEAVQKLGVACVSCHVTEEGFVLAAAAPSGDRAANAAVRAPHPLRRSIDFARTGGCARCHEFRFPMPAGDEDEYFMQTTVREHQRSPAAARACADCHMPAREGRRSHSFAEVRDPAWLKSNLEVKAERVEGDTLRITLVQPAPGHGFPTGDLFRRLEVGCELQGEGGNVLRREVRHLARHFESIPGRPGRTLVRDDRVQSQPMVVEMVLALPSPTPRPGRISFWVTYQRVATVGAGTNPADARIESEVKLHSGVLPWDTN